MADLIERQAAIDEIARWIGYIDEDMILRIQTGLKKVPSAQPTLYGYSIEHLVLIARVMQKENVTPEKAIECFKDVGRMVQMIVDEQQEMIKRAVEKWTI